MLPFWRPGSSPTALRARCQMYADAQLVLVGDHRQLGAVETGGLFRLLVADNHAAELSGVRRFSHRWEANATLRLRQSDDSVLGDYQARLIGVQLGLALRWRTAPRRGARIKRVSRLSGGSHALRASARIRQSRTGAVHAPRLPTLCVAKRDASPYVPDGGSALTQRLWSQRRVGSRNACSPWWCGL
jgi:hypothetical protein